ncbi:hypothetical protein [Novosphingobium sp. M1R2S20]|uniref:Response regulatory domain-containing protein n=1 Tax=Novosphingobium rhizovicinum TaxID=3228928 RepID=A0ABV3R896_9SPHN
MRSDGQLHVLVVSQSIDALKGAWWPPGSHKDLALHYAGSLDEARTMLALEPIDLMIVSAGLGLSERLAIARAAFEQSDSITVHMKDKASGQAGLIPFIERVIAARQRG